MKYEGEILSIDDMRLLDECERRIQATHATLPETGQAISMIGKGLWRATDQTFEQYLRRRWGMSVRFAGALMVAGAALDKEQWKDRPTVKLMATAQEMDTATDAVVASLDTNGCVTTFHVEQVMGHLRSAREITIDHLAKYHPTKLDYRAWLLALRDLALRLKEAFANVRFDDCRTASVRTGGDASIAAEQ